jgi:hypothetical protein
MDTVKVAIQPLVLVIILLVVVVAVDILPILF